MQSRPVSRNQAHSQPILPSHQSRYFHNGIVNHPAFPPRWSRSPVAIASPRGYMPLQAQPQPHPHQFFTQGPAAMGYIPQQAPRYPRRPSSREPIVPLRTQFHGSDRPTTSSQAQLKTLTTKSSSLNVAANAAQLSSQHYINESTSSHKTAYQEKSLGSQSQPLNKPANSKKKGLNKRPNDACATNHETFEPTPKIRLVNWHTHHSKGSSQRAHNTSTSTFAQVNKHASQEYQPSQILPETLESDIITGAVGEDLTHAEPSRAKELSQPRPIKADQETEAKTTSNTSVPIVEHLHRTLDPPPYSHQDQSSASEILLLTQNSPIRDEPINTDTLTFGLTKRSASQATTVYTTSTQLSFTAEDEDVPEEKESINPMSMINETMILERDLSDIVNTRLLEGEPYSLDALYGEILIKMAVKDDELFEAVSRMLKS
ncbi:hypothetical protein F4801DRAFT_529426 [Xylaria longipes]|nr:hypothetical protein F4801DRAFT_529426 [Xylaria longipes]